MGLLSWDELFGSCGFFLRGRKSVSLKPEEGREDARPREDANEAMSDWIFSILSGVAWELFLGLEFAISTPTIENLVFKDHIQIGNLGFKDHIHQVTNNTLKKQRKDYEMANAS